MWLRSGFLGRMMVTCAADDGNSAESYRSLCRGNSNGFYMFTIYTLGKKELNK